MYFFLHQVVVGAFRKISKASWNAKERFFFLSFVNVLFQCNVVSHKKNKKNVLFQWISKFWFVVFALSLTSAIFDDDC